jgi:hypothetical protein
MVKARTKTLTLQLKTPSLTNPQSVVVQTVLREVVRAAGVFPAIHATKNSALEPLAETGGPSKIQESPLTTCLRLRPRVGLLDAGAEVALVGGAVAGVEVAGVEAWVDEVVAQQEVAKRGWASPEGNDQSFCLYSTGVSATIRLKQNYTLILDGIITRKQKVLRTAMDTRMWH